MFHRRLIARLSVVLVSLTLFAVTASAVSPTEEAIQKWKAEGVWEEKVATWEAFRAAGGCTPSEYSSSFKDRFTSKMALSSRAVDTARVLVILVDFPDYHYDDTQYDTNGVVVLSTSVTGTVGQFDSLLFTRQGIDTVFNPTGSMTEYYLETSYSQYHIRGDVVGWFTVPYGYSHYVGQNDGLGGGGAELAGHAIDAAEAAGVDFSVYADQLNRVPGVIVVHAGPGAEGGTYGIWSHRSNVSRAYDGVIIHDYTMNPEEHAGTPTISNMGVFCHEWGHILGLPDLYDIDYNPGSRGLGYWSIMASGSWNNGGRSPAHFDAWCKLSLGFVDAVWLGDTIPEPDIPMNITHAAVPQVETNPVIYGLKDNPQPGGPLTEYWLVENRQRVGFDAYLPGEGLCIYHIDNSVSTNTNPVRYHVALEQADGLNQLAFAGSGGDTGDPWPGWTNSRNFHDYTVPSSRLNVDDTTEVGIRSEVGVWNISDSDSLMYADLDVVYFRPYLILSGDSITMTDDSPGGNGDGVFVQGETVEFDIEVRNLMGQSFNPTVNLSVDRPGIEFIQNDVALNGPLNPIFDQHTVEPIIFRIPDDFRSAMTTFTVTIFSDSQFFPGGDRTFQSTFEFDLVLGNPQILLVDDDDGTGDQSGYTNVFDRLGIPLDIWDKSVSSSPAPADLAVYQIVFWMTGRERSGVGGILTADDVTAMEQYLDGGGNLVLASATAAGQLHALDSAFMATHLHATHVGSSSGRHFYGLAGNLVGDDMHYWLTGSAPFYLTRQIIDPVNSGEKAFIITDESQSDHGTCGVTYDGSYRTVFLTFPVEYLEDNGILSGYMPKDTLVERILTFFYEGSPTPVEDDDKTEALLPAGFALEQNYPNPFNPATTISYAIGAGKPVLIDLSIFNVLGRKVATVVNEVQGPGTYTVIWDGVTATDSRAASGVYFYRLLREDRCETRKMVLLK